MRSPFALPALVERRLRVFRGHLAGALGGDVTAVHQARVASRRLREVLPIAGVFAKRVRDADRAQRRMRRITRALGPVRELDVTLGLLEGLSKEHEPLGGAIAATREAVVAEREVRREWLLARVTTSFADETIEHIHALVEGTGAGNPAWRRALAHRVIERTAGLREAIEAAGMVYAMDTLHAVRIAAKKLRYTLELAGEARAANTARLVVRLKEAQDHLGELHDLHVLAAFASRAAEQRAAVRTDVARLLGLLEAQCHALHADYLEHRLALVGAADGTRDRVVPRLTERRPSTAAGRQSA